MVTLGISNNTRLLALAIINQGRLEDYRLQLHKSPWSLRKADNMITTSLEPCVRQYCPKKVVLSIPRSYHQTDAYKLLISSIIEYFKSKSIPLYLKNVEELRDLIHHNGRGCKKKIMEALTLQYPQLSLCYHKEIRNKRRYYYKVFEAVGVATLLEKEK